MRQSKPDYTLVFMSHVPKTFQLIPSSLGRGLGVGVPGLRSRAESRTIPPGIAFRVEGLGVRFLQWGFRGHSLDVGIQGVGMSPPPYPLA